MKSHKTTLLLGLLSMSAGVALAQDGEPKGPPGGGNRLGEFLKRADANADSKISKEEFKTLSKRDDADDRFTKMDANADGYVDEAEIAKVAEKMRNRPDGEGKGKGEGGGFRRPPEGGPDGAPKPDGDRPGRPEGGRPEGSPPGGPGGPGGAAMMDELFGRMDKNNDGGVDKDEYIEFAKQETETRFTRTDENADGKLTKEEVKAGLERMRNMPRGRGPGGPGGRGPGAEGGPRGGRDGGEGGFRRPPNPDGKEGEKPTPRPEFETEAPKKDPA